MPPTDRKPSPPYAFLWRGIETLLRSKMADMRRRVKIAKALAKEDPEAPPPIDLKDLNSFSLILKRAQDAQRALAAEAADAEIATDDAETQHDAFEFAPERLSRLAEFLRDEEHEGDEGDPEEAL